MINTLKLSTLALIAGSLLAGAAQAQTLPQAQAVRVSVIGKNAKAVHAEFVRAARQVCAGEDTEISYAADTDHAACMRATLAKAEFDYRQMKTQQLALARGE